ncbi:VF530 family protein [Paraglaciecola sp.]|uniref:VF530 family protein n=1 Tax=Paraglaciecola sp. TaxID=1920173 RepID=UPI00326705EC
MAEQQKNNPLHGLTLQIILETLESQLGFEEMGKHVRIKCFTSDPSIKSSLKFLRKTPWAREKVEQLYLSAINSPTHTQNDDSSNFVWPDITNKTE